MTKQLHQPSRKTSSITNFCTWDKQQVGSRFDRTTSLGVTPLKVCLEVYQLEAHQATAGSCYSGKQDSRVDHGKNSQHLMCGFFRLSLCLLKKNQGVCFTCTFKMCQKNKQQSSLETILLTKKIHYNFEFNCIFSSTVSKPTVFQKRNTSSIESRFKTEPGYQLRRHTIKKNLFKIKQTLISFKNI